MVSFRLKKRAASQRQDSQYGYSTLRTDNKGVVRDGPGSRSIHQCRRLRVACTTNRFLARLLLAKAAVAMPLTVGMETGLYSGFPMVRSNFPCP